MLKKLLIIIIIGYFVAGWLKNRKTNDDKLVLDSIYYNKGEYIEINSDYLNNKSHKNYVLFAYNNFCTLPVSCENIFKEYMKKNKIDFLSINIDEYKKTKLYEKVSFVPTIIIVSNGSIIAYLDAEKDDDFDKYQDIDKFSSWINNYIFIKK